MKKDILKLLSAAVATAVLTGCTGGAAPAAAPAPFVEMCMQDGAQAPEWTCNPYLEGSIVALGVAQKNAGNDQGMQRAEAIAEARVALVNQLNVKVSTMFKSFKATTGSGDSATFDKSNSQVSKQLASETLQGSRAVKTWKSAAGTMFVLVGISNEPVKQKMEAAVKTSFKNDGAMYQKFLAAKEQGELDKELEKSAE